ncbi:hypothetical protein SK128_026051 [Halocaridina rubra]|uniref:C-type lectin n=1 Tax=Halocaridina rubra TaxID=373956 RepID=A0AAN8ZZG7_HALRR
MVPAILLLTLGFISQEVNANVFSVYPNVTLRPAAVTEIKWGVPKECICRVTCFVSLNCTGVSIVKNSTTDAFDCHMTSTEYILGEITSEEGTITLYSPNYLCESYAIPNVGCFHVEMEPLSWDNATRNCIARGSELFMARTADEFHVADDIMLEKGVTNWWVDAKSRQWGNGRPVLQVNGLVRHPNDPVDYCIRKKVSEGVYLMDDRDCSILYPSGCLTHFI